MRRSYALVLSIFSVVALMATFCSIIAASGATPTATSSGGTVVILPPCSKRAFDTFWADSDIGTFTPAGKALCQGDSVEITGAGADIGGQADLFHYVYHTLSSGGDITIVARLKDMQPVWTAEPGTTNMDKAGIMIRQDPSAGQNPSTSKAQGQTTSTPAPAPSIVTGQQSTPWMKLQRQGDTFTGWVSSDGTNWGNPISKVTISMPDPILVGLAVTPNNSNLTDTATFDNIQVTSP